MSENEQLATLRGVMERHLAALHRHRARYVNAWIAATGLHPTECELVYRQDDDGVTTIRIQRRGDSPPPSENVHSEQK